MAVFHKDILIELAQFILLVLILISRNFQININKSCAHKLIIHMYPYTHSHVSSYDLEYSASCVH